MKASNKPRRAARLKTRALAAQVNATRAVPFVSEKRGAFSYRGVVRNVARSRNAARLKRERLELGITRQEYDRLRWYETNFNEDV